MAANVFELWGEIALKGNELVKRQLKDLGNNAKEVGDKFKGVGEGMSKWVTAPLAAVGVGAMKVASDMQSAQGSMQAQLGITAKEAAGLTKTAKELWTQGFGTDMADVTNKVAAVTRTLGDLNKTDLKAVTAGLDVLEKNFGADSQESMAAVDTLMKNFGMSATEAMDYLTAGYQNNLDYSGEFIDSIREYSTYFSEMGLTGDEFFNTLKAGAEGGAFQLDKVGDAMKEFTLRSKDGSKLSSQGFQMLGLNADEMTAKFNQGGKVGKEAFTTVLQSLQKIEDPQKRNAAATALFGTQYEDLGKSAFDALLKANGGLKNVEGSSKRASDAMQKGFGPRLQATWRTTQAALEPLGIVLLDMADKILPKITSAVQTVSTWFTNLSPAGQQMITMFGLIAAAIGPLLMGLGTIIGAIGPLIPVIIKVWGWISKLRMVFTLLRTAFLFMTGPIGIVIGIIAALIIIGIKVYQNWDTISKKGSAIWAVIWGFLKKYGLMLLGPLGALIALGIKIYKNWDTISARGKAIWGAIWGFIKKYGLMILGPFGTLIAIGIKLYKNWDTIRAKISTAASAIWTAVKTKFEQIKTAMIKPVEAAHKKVKEFIEKIKGFFTGLKLKIPKIGLPTLPKLSISGKLSIKPPSVPKLKWMAKGGIFNKPDIVGIGEKGPEAAIPLMGKAMRPFAQAIASQMPGAAAGGALNITVPVYLDGREIARASAGNMDRELETIRRRTARNRGITT